MASIPNSLCPSHASITQKIPQSLQSNPPPPQSMFTTTTASSIPTSPCPCTVPKLQAAHPPSIQRRCDLAAAQPATSQSLIHHDAALIHGSFSASIQSQASSSAVDPKDRSST
ncbi:hypothetical protein M0R45_006470 [Rubus argutus]|uniref:Uncharacterized protein n=1 Tax=Rubus argutus TaxID=59490 RepID=A0AAW1YR45_RUBAR